ncbi:MAG: ACT domain-containing protein [Planctomycetota bacterium]|jgi:hypothetical protein
MDLMVQRVDVWAASVKDEPGGLARKLATLAEAGADLDFVIARRSPEKPGSGVVFVTPLRGDREVAAAAEVGFSSASGLHSVRVEGPNKRGAAAELTRKLAAEGINLRGLSAAVIGTRFIIYLALDTTEDAASAVRILKEAS